METMTREELDEAMPDQIWAVDGGETDHAEFFAGTWTNSPTHGIGKKTLYVRARLQAREEPNDRWEVVKRELEKNLHYASGKDVGPASDALRHLDRLREQHAVVKGLADALRDVLKSECPSKEGCKIIRSALADYDRQATERGNG